MQRRTWVTRILCGLVAGGVGAPSLAREPVATVLGQTVYRDQLRGPKSELGPLIVPPLLRRFAAEHRLAATEAEIDEFLAATKMPLPADLSAADRAELRKIPEAMVLQWKISRALYQRYGGDVIFQQGNPLEPVGAMRQFLEEQEAAQAFTIHHAADRERFYAYYLRTDHRALPASKVDYSEPWWRRLPSTPR